MSVVDIQFAGKSFKFENANGADQVARQMESGSYEPPLPMLMMATLLRMEGAFIDVGANTGLYTVLAGIIVPNRPILAFEPHPVIADIFRNNLTSNNLTENVQVFPIGLSDQAGTASLYMPDQSHGLLETSASLEWDFQPVASKIQIEIKRLDDLEITARVAVIKVDIEGHEYAFLKGAQVLIERDRPIIFAEILPIAKRNLIAQFLRSTSYIDFRLRPDMAIHDGDVLYDDAAWNHAFVPIERLDKFRESCAACNVLVLRQFTTKY